jgi:DNA-binding transcriptional LysR family regulator
LKDWDDLKFVLALSRAGTMKAAADMLGANSATVSRRLDKLSGDLGLQLFQKEAAGWRPTTEAMPLIDLASRIEAELETIQNAVSRPDKELSGKVAISSYQTIASFALIPWLERFRDRYPNLALEIDYQANRSLAHGEIDRALRLTRPTEGRLIAKRIGTRYSRYYIRKGCELGKDWLGLSKEFDHLPMMKQGFSHFGHAPAARLASLSDVRQAIENSDMPGPLLTCNARLSATIEPLDLDALNSRRPIYLIYHESRRNDPLLKIVKDWVTSCFTDPQSCPCGQCENLTLIDDNDE